MTEFCIAPATDKEEIIDFINYVFSQAHNPHDFKKLLPKSYADDAIGTGTVHYVAKKDGKIKAVVSSRIIDVSVGGKILKYGLIGNVAVHPYSRGAGYMKELMRMAIEDSEQRGVDLMALGGQRQRYGYFGFENVGANLQFTVTDKTIRHCFGSLDVSDISLQDFESASDEALQQAIVLYESRAFHAIRPWAEYRNIMRSWNHVSRLILRKDEIIGYCCGGEIVLKNEADLGAVLKVLFTVAALPKMELTVAPYQKERAAFLAGICESSCIAEAEKIRILNPEKVLQTLLFFKAAYTRLKDGTALLDIDGEGLQITVTDGVPTVQKAAVTDDFLHMTLNEAQMRLFGLNSLLLPEETFKNWAPLPFMIDAPDSF